MKVGVNNFVRRQILGSGKTYSRTLNFEEIAAHAESQMNKGFFTEGYRSGVRIVHVDQSIIKEFQCPYTKIDENSDLIAKVVKRQEDEEPYIQIRCKNGEPLIAGSVDLILYHHDVLMENNEQTTDNEWELISINAIPEKLNKLPMGPVTMMRNQLELKGGTAAFYESRDWAESIRFWQKYAAIEPR